MSQKLWGGVSSVYSLRGGRDATRQSLLYSPRCLCKVLASRLDDVEEHDVSSGISDQRLIERPVRFPSFRRLKFLSLSTLPRAANGLGASPTCVPDIRSFLLSLSRPHSARDGTLLVRGVRE